jgi:hypothetical protein
MDAILFVACLGGLSLWFFRAPGKVVVRHAPAAFSSLSVVRAFKGGR